MSLTTWKRAFYPSPAVRIQTRAGAIAHSRRKWAGATRQALRAHGLVWYPSVCDEHPGVGYLREGIPALTFNDKTCALCVCFQHTPGDLRCTACPLAQARGGVPCDQTMAHETTAPYAAACRGRTEPMRRWLRRIR